MSPSSADNLGQLCASLIRACGNVEFFMSPSSAYNLGQLCASLMSACPYTCLVAIFCPFSYLGGESSFTSKRFGTSQAFTEGAGATMLVITFSLLFSLALIPSMIPAMASLLTGLPWKLRRSSWPIIPLPLKVLATKQVGVGDSLA